MTAETALIALDLDGVMVSSGSACSSGKVDASHVLAAMGVDDDSRLRPARQLRLEFHQEDADAVLASLVKLVARARPRAAA